MASGRLSVEQVNHYSIHRHLAGYPKATIRVVYPDQGKEDTGMAMNVTGVAISNYSDRQKEARHGWTFRSPRRGRRYSSNKTTNTRTGAPLPKAMRPLNPLKNAKVPMPELWTYRQETIDLLAKIGLP